MVGSGKSKVSVAVDTLGGDYAPRPMIQGALRAAEEFGLAITFLGIPERIEAILKQYAWNGFDINIEPVSDHETMLVPGMGLRRATTAPAVGARLLRDGKVDALVSASDTGMILAAAILFAGRIEGVHRPCLAAPLPTPDKYVLLLDAGANPDCQPFHLVEFALLGARYAQHCMGLKQPRVFVLSNGREDSKGNDLIRAVHAELSALPHLKYHGFAEPYDLLGGEVDVLVTDGFSGNLLVKGMESASQLYTAGLQQAFLSSWRGRTGYWLARKDLQKVRQRADPRQYGGAILLGVNGIVIVAHGNSNAKSIYSVLRQAKDGVKQDIVGRMTQSLKEYHQHQSISERT